MKKEIQKYYHISPDGAVYSFRRHKQLKPKIDKYGYFVFCLSLDIGIKYITAGRLVALFYISNPRNYPQVNHKDGNKLNNHYTNLEWCTAQHNTQHAYDSGLAKAWNKNKKNIYSQDVIKSNRLNQKLRKPVDLIKENVIVASFDSLRHLCKEMGFDRRTAMRVLKGEVSYHTIKGFKISTQ